MNDTAQWALDALAALASSFCLVQFLPSACCTTLEVEGRRYRVLKQIGEGGYAFVFLAREVYPSGALAAEPVAIKKIIAGSPEKLQHAQHEVAVLQALSHANCLPLLGHSVNPISDSGGRAHEVLLVLPAYEDGTLLDELDRLAVEGRQLGSRDVLLIFRQLCAGISHMHSRGYAHMDVKPHNVLIQRPSRSRRQQQQQQQSCAPPGPVAPPPPPPPAAARARQQGGRGRDGDGDGHGRGDGGMDREAAGLAGDMEAVVSLVARGYQAVLMDFGSARPMPIVVSSRAQALALQEDAEAHSTATYRAPELFDVPSSCSITPAVDVWALGCTLYAMMCGASPFQHALDQGASLALAVLNCKVPWPSSAPPRYPLSLRELVTDCLRVDAWRRPTLPQLLERVDDLLAGPL